MKKEVTLKDGRNVVIREMREGDTDAMFAFFAGLPSQDRKYLRADVTRREVLQHRYKDVEFGRARRLIALEDGAIIADGALELKGHGWGENIAEIRLIVAQEYQRAGLGTLLARELHMLAAENKVSRIVARLMRPQLGAHRILHSLGFHEEFLIPQMVLDRDGHWQDMIIMRCNLEDLWREMETSLELSDWQRHR